MSHKSGFGTSSNEYKTGWAESGGARLAILLLYCNTRTHLIQKQTTRVTVPLLISDLDLTLILTLTLMCDLYCNMMIQTRHLRIIRM